MPLLTSDLEASSVSLLEMAKDNNRSKHHWSEDSSHGS
jgi:hypothetical protein